MSISKRRAQKSFNHSSLSQVSHSQNLRECCLFKNNALAQIQNGALGSQSKSSRKEHLFQSNSAKKRAFNAVQSKKENQGTSKQNQKSKQNRALNYTGLSKMMDERNGTIEAQAKQIENLKTTLDKVRKELELTRIDFEKRKLEDLASLKRQERDNQENIKELEILRVGIKQLKNRVQALQLEKAQLQKKSSEYFRENEQLTIKLTSLKQQYIEKLPSEQTLSTLKHQLEVMKQQSKLTKQLQLQKTALDQRCRSFQRKINQYILKYNEIQSEHNQMQIKYYRAQKDNDDIKIQLHQLQAQNRSLQRMLEEQRKSMTEIVDKWKNRIAKLQERGDGRTTLQQRINVGDLEQRCAKLQKLTHIQHELQQCLQQKAALASKLMEAQTKISSLTIQFNAMTHKLSQNQVESSKILETCQLKIRTLQQKLMICNDKIKNGDQAGLRLESQIQIQRKMQEETERKLLQMENRLKQSVQIGLGQAREIDELEKIRNQQQQEYCKQIQQLKQAIIISQNQQQIISEKSKKTSLDLHNTIQLLKLRSKQVQEIQQKYSLLNEVLITKQNQITVLMSEIEHSQSQIKQNQQQHNTTQLDLQERIAKLQKSVEHLQNINQSSVREIGIKNSQIHRLESVVSKVNAELKDIKAIVHDYKEQINKCNETMIQQDRKIQNQAFLSRQAELKYQQQLKYFKDKYDQGFKHSVNLSAKICSLQHELTEQLNKCTEQARANSNLQNKIRKCIQQKNDIESKLTEQTRRFQDQNYEHHNQTEKTNTIINNLNNRISELEVLNRTQQTKLIVLQQKSKAQKQEYIEQIDKLVANHNRQITQHQKQYQQLSSLNIAQQIKVTKLQQELAQNIHINRQQTHQIQSQSQQLQTVKLELQSKSDTLINAQLKLQCVIKEKSLMESQEIGRIKEYNFKLIQQAQQTAVQFNKNCVQLREQAELSHKYRTMINSLQKQSNELRNRNIELAAQVQRTRERARADIQDKDRNINTLKAQVSAHQQKIRLQSVQISTWLQKYQIWERELKKAQSQCNRMSRSFLEQGSRKNKQNSREVQANRAQIKLLQQQNMNLQKIMDKQLNKRKIIIQELIHEKKLLYQQIGHH